MAYPPAVGDVYDGLRLRNGNTASIAAKIIQAPGFIRGLFALILTFFADLYS
ncbi:MAG: hypothetical protein V7L01_18740 [Nostoc sp.]|uniref:hypothetical protein n=1 Tax=Nostoc sp. TaxID=1180 RepID=UPI002FF7942B